MSFHDYIYDPSSLTKKLRAAAAQNFFVNVLSEAFVEVAAENLPLLNLTGVQTLWRREVELYVDEMPWIHAVTWIPRETLTGPGEALLTLGNHSLGDLLATDKNLRRSEFVLAEAGITRSSVFYFFGKPLVVTEKFLPKALAYFSKPL